MQVFLSGFTACDLTKHLANKIYIFSGLGADERVFQRLDFSPHIPIFIRWIIPQNQETIESYSMRISNQIKVANPILMGISFGGIVAMEVAKQIKSEKVILIASAKTKDEIPFYYKIAGKINLHKLLPASLLKTSNCITNWFFGANDNFDRKILKQVLEDTDPHFLKWAMDKIVKWENTTIPTTILHIHGTNDRILPCLFIDCTILIKNGGHLMSLNKSVELTEVLRHNL